MANLDQDRLNHFRQRWVDENFKDYLEGSYSLRNSSVGDNHQGLVGVLADREPVVRGDSINLGRPANPKNRLSWHSSFFGKYEQRLSDNIVILPTVAPESNDLNEQTVTLTTFDTSIETGGLSTWLTEAYTTSWLIFFSILGTLARLGIEAITIYPNAPVTSRVLWANIGGCFTMGLLTKDQPLFEHPVVREDLEEHSAETPHEATTDHAKSKQLIPLYIGLTAGFCSSLTSFSGFMCDAFLAMTNDLEPPSSTKLYHSMTTGAHRNGGYSFLALSAILILHPGLSLIAFRCGNQFASFIKPIRKPLPDKLIAKILNPLIIPLSICSWLLVALTLSIIPPYEATNWRTRALLPLMFAPAGCLARHYLSKPMNKTDITFPLGTFTANITATLLVGISFDLQHYHPIGATNQTACAVLNGVMQGFCATLGSVSAWVTELQTLSRRHGWIYGLASVGAGLAALVCVMGGMGWSIGFERPVCG